MRGRETKPSDASWAIDSRRAPASAWVSGTATTEGIRHHDLRGHLGRDDVPAAQRDDRSAPASSRFIAGCAKFWLDSSSWMPGRCERTTRASRATSRCVETPANAIRTVPTSPPSAERTAVSARRSASRTSLAGSDQRLAAGGEPHRPRVAVEQPCAQLPLELFDRPAQRRLGDVQPLGGTAEVQLLGHGQKGPQSVQYPWCLSSAPLYCFIGITERLIKYWTDLN